MKLFLSGCNYRTAGVGIRERFGFGSEAERAKSARELTQAHPEAEAVILNTCHRVEIVFAGPARPTPAWFPASLFRSHFYHYKDEEVIRHLFRLTAGLDSMVVGEAQIVSQIKNSYLAAQRAGATGPVLDRLFQRAIGLARTIREQTPIGQIEDSVASLAVNFISNHVPNLTGMKLLCLGAGQMARLALTALRDRGVHECILVSRTEARTRKLAESFGTAGNINTLDHYLARVDLVLTTSAAPHPLITAAKLRPVLARRTSPLFILDIAVPRDIAADVKDLDGVSLFDIDDLREEADELRTVRAPIISQAEPMIQREVSAYTDWLALRRMGPLLGALYARAHAWTDREAEALIRRLPGLDDRQKNLIRTHLRRTVNRMLHPIVAEIKSDCARGEDREDTLYRLLAAWPGQHREQVKEHILSTTLRELGMTG